MHRQSHHVGSRTARQRSRSAGSSTNEASQEVTVQLSMCLGVPDPWTQIPQE